MADYTAPTRYPFQDSPSTVNSTLYAADINGVIAQLLDLAAVTTGRVPVLEAAAAKNSGALWRPDDHGYLGWTTENENAGSSTVLASAGVLYATKLKLAAAGTVNKICCRVTTAGNTLTNTYLALLDSTGARAAVSADQSAVFNAAGYHEVSTTAPYAAAAGTYYACVLCGSATTLPTLARAANSAILNDGLTAAAGFRAWSSGTGQTAVPASVTLSGTAALSQNFWFALK